ncbi:uncharacterized protein ATNIH1004_003332 [Aspergillus tanneri]|nr:uncharacterized protein ATNIH1004_003332 [Aspergillus tanneri]KAA8650644.1 hypothetical protein ATNIH1004_003332 [Aspergillus tanneri]
MLGPMQDHTGCPELKLPLGQLLLDVRKCLVMELFTQSAADFIDLQDGSPKYSLCNDSQVEGTASEPGSHTSKGSCTDGRIVVYRQLVEDTGKLVVAVAAVRFQLYRPWFKRKQVDARKATHAR